MLLACALQPCMCMNGLTATCSSKESTDDCVILSARISVTVHDQLPSRPAASVSMGKQSIRVSVHIQEL